jgi:hypothetical protein
MLLSFEPEEWPDQLRALAEVGVPADPEECLYRVLELLELPDFEVSLVSWAPLVIRRTRIKRVRTPAALDAIVRMVRLAAWSGRRHAICARLNPTRAKAARRV